MKTQNLLLAALAGASLTAQAAEMPREFTLSADRMAADRVTGSAVATGHVRAVAGPATLRGEYAVRDAQGVVVFREPTSLTTCSNEVGHLHWSIDGEVEYLNGKYVLGRNVLFKFCEVPYFWLPYFYYPLEHDTGVRVMPGYSDKWGAYILTKYIYHLAGDPDYGEDTAWLRANTRFDMRYKNGFGLGETLNWNLARFGQGHVKGYYAWDENADHYDRHWDDLRHYNYLNWGSEVDRERYAVEFAHRWEATERDSVRVAGIVRSDSHLMRDYFRRTAFGLRNDWIDAKNEVAWEHVENAWGGGVSVSGPLDEFEGGTARLPEIYLDVAPRPVFGLPINYESENRFGFLDRSYARYGDDEITPFSRIPGVWADYDTARFDTYHRITAPFKAWDVLSVVPRIAYHGTYWDKSGGTDLEGWSRADRNARIYRSILEGGVTFSGRGTSWIGSGIRHTTEPYADVLAQKAWYLGDGSGRRPYVFDAIDASVQWDDQFAGRSRNLPYSYYGVTPGWRNAFAKTDDKGNLRTFLDFDVYAALQFNSADWSEGDEFHRLADLGSPNYGEDGIYATPGFRVRWTPAEDILLGARLEYDPDRNTVAVGDLEWRQKVDRNLDYFVRYSARNYRIWDYSSVPYDSEIMTGEDLNMARLDFLSVGFEHEICDAIAWSPYLRWDCRDGELDSVGTWIDYRTDCLGFRLLLAYENDYTRIDRSVYDDDFHVGFFIYLRALGPSSGDFFSGK